MPKPLSPKRNPVLTPSRSGLAERAGAGNIVRLPSPTPDKPLRSPSKTTTTTTATPSGSSKKLRMQSPQKLRERLHAEQAAIAAASTSLQDELAKISEELTSTSTSSGTPSRGGSLRAPKTYTPTRPALLPPVLTPSAIQHQQGQNPMELAQRVLKVEGLLTAKMGEVEARVAGIASDVSSSLSVSEAKCKSLDALYREANGENEALYARVNEELARVVKGVKGGEGMEEVKRLLKEAQEESAGLRRENGRLRREVAGLRAQLREEK